MSTRKVRGCGCEIGWIRDDQTAVEVIVRPCQQHRGYSLLETLRRAELMFHGKRRVDDGG